LTDNNPTRRKRDIYDRIIDSLESQERGFIQSLKVASSDSSVTLSGFGGGPGSGGGNPGSGGGPFLPLDGGSMNGPIAYGPKATSTFIDGSNRGHLNVSKDRGKFTSNVILNGTPSNWNLSYIDGDYWDGQILRVHIPLGSTLILHDDGNLQLPPNMTSFQIKGPVWFEVMFDFTLSPNGNSGAWELTNTTFQINGCDVATKCYVDNLFIVAGFTQGGVTENISESAWVCLACFFNAPVIADPTPIGGMSESVAVSVI
jgi:hypothetical protein